MRPLRGAVHWLADYRNGLTIIASVVVVLTVHTVVDAGRTRNAAIKAATAEANQAHSLQQASTRRIDMLTDDITGLRSELDAVLSATTDEQRRQAVAAADARRATTTTATTVPANPPATAPQSPPPVTQPSTTTTTAPVPPPSTPPTTTCTTLPVVGTCAPGRASRSDTTGRCGGWLELVASYDWPIDHACSVLWCESKGDPDAVNPSSGATGLFQILRGPTDPAENVALAYDMWSHRGWQPWVCR